MRTSIQTSERLCGSLSGASTLAVECRDGTCSVNLPCVLVASWSLLACAQVLQDHVQISFCSGGIWIKSCCWASLLADIDKDPSMCKPRTSSGRAEVDTQLWNHYLSVRSNPSFLSSHCTSQLCRCSLACLLPPFRCSSALLRNYPIFLGENSHVK